MNTSNCLPECSGLIVASFFKSGDKQQDFGDMFGHVKTVGNAIKNYRKYTKWTKLPPGLKGMKMSE